MVLTYEDRIKLLEKARAAKAAKRAGLNKKSEPEPEPEPAPAPAPKPVKTRVKKQQQPLGRTLELPPEPEVLSDEEPEIEERIVYRPKPQKKKKIIRTIIKDQSSEEEEEIHETVEQPPKPKKQISNKQPKLCPSKSSYFCY